jgi:nitrate reductase gamma subunit
MTLEQTLKSIGDGLGGIFNGIAVPLGTLIIILGIAGAIGVLLRRIFDNVGY